MNVEAIENFFTTKKTVGEKTTIQFRKRNTLTGVFVKGKDYEELKEKNFWRIVTGSSIETFNKTNDLTLARIFSGLEMVKLT